MPIFTAPVNMRFTGATAAGSTVWVMRAGTTVPLNIRRIVLFGAFDGTAAATTARYEVKRFRTAAPTGGTAITAVPEDLNAVGTTTVTLLQETTGAALTVTSVVFDTAMMTAMACARGATGANVSVNLDFTDSPIVIDPSDGLCIQNQQAAVIGDSLSGFIEWEE